jgi:hypothetical protein
MSIKSITLAFVMAMGLTTSAGGVAQTGLSEGCDYVNNDFYDAAYGDSGSNDRDFAANEIIIVSATTPIITGTPTTISFFVNGIEVDTDGFPGTVSYRVLADGPVLPSWRIDNANVSWTAECFAGEPLPSVATPIPTLGWQGIALLATLLAGFAYYRRRKVIT